MGSKKVAISLGCAALATLVWALGVRDRVGTFWWAIVQSPAYFLDVFVVAGSAHSMNWWVRRFTPFLSFYSLTYGVASALGGLRRALRQERPFISLSRPIITWPVIIGLGCGTLGTLGVVGAMLNYSGWPESLLHVVPDAVAFFLAFFALGHLTWVTVTRVSSRVVPLSGTVLSAAGTAAAMVLAAKWWWLVGPLYLAGIGIGLAGTGIFSWEAYRWRNRVLADIQARAKPISGRHWLIMLGACIGVMLGEGIVFWELRSRGFATDLPSFLLLLVVALSALLVLVVLRDMREQE